MQSPDRDCSQRPDSLIAEAAMWDSTGVLHAVLCGDCRCPSD